MLEQKLPAAAASPPRHCARNDTRKASRVARSPFTKGLQMRAPEDFNEATTLCDFIACAVMRNNQAHPLWLHSCGVPAKTLQVTTATSNLYSFLCKSNANVISYQSEPKLKLWIFNRLSALVFVDPLIAVYETSTRRRLSTRQVATICVKLWFLWE